LISKGAKAGQLRAKGYGESMPIEPNRIDGKDNPEGRAKNRRTEFKVLKNE
jgi:outer membrane protein OmpA-like peptidoglycan-associated protein